MEVEVVVDAVVQAINTATSEAVFVAIVHEVANRVRKIRVNGVITGRGKRIAGREIIGLLPEQLLFLQKLGVLFFLLSVLDVVLFDDFGRRSP